MPPLVSVCLITYKHENYIRQAVDGVLAQQISFEWEFIIADDCSPDSTQAILQEYKRKYPDLIKLIFQEKNVGGGNNFAALLAAANGKYIAYLEGDDYWTYPLKLQTQIDFLESNPEYGLVCTDAQFYDQQSRHFIKRNPYHAKSCDITFDKLLRKNTIISFTVVLRTHIYKKIQHMNEVMANEGWKIGDYPLWLELSNLSKIRYFDLQSGVYRVLQSSATSRTDKAKRIEFEKSAYAIRQYFITKYESNNKKLLRQAWFEYKISLLKFSLRTFDIKEAIKIMAEIMKPQFLLFIFR